MSDPLRNLAEQLATVLPESIPAEALRVERDRGFRDLLDGRPARITLLEVRDGPLALRLEEGEALPAAGAGPAPEGPPMLPLLVRTVHGVVISRRQVDPVRWLAQLDRTVHSLSQQSERTRAAAHRLLAGLGAVTPSEGIGVDDDDLVAGLTGLAGRLHGLVPADVEATVSRIADTLLRALATADDERQHWMITRIATDYLPTTLRVYLDLPPGWGDPHGVADGRTPLDLLREQLAVLEGGTDEAYQAALADDATRLLANGTFLLDRFGGPGGNLSIPDASAPGGSPPAPPPGPVLATESQVIALFRMLDSDRDGALDGAELQALMTRLGEPLDGDAVGLLLGGADTDHDGRITAAELISYLVPGNPPPG